MPYPMPTVNDTGGILEYFRYINTASDGIFFPAMLGAIWVIIFIGSLASGKSSSASKAWTFSSFIVMVLAIMLSVLDLCLARYAYWSILFLAAGVTWIIIEEKS